MIVASLYEKSSGIDQRVVIEAVNCLNGGGVVLTPTDTVYGLAVRMDREDAVSKIYRMKSREAAKPLVLQVYNEARAKPMLREWDESWEWFARRFWPGPLTLIGWSSPLVPRWISRGNATVALRCPDEPGLLSILQLIPVPLAVTSANLSGTKPGATLRESLAALAGAPDLALDGGPAKLGIESTVLDLTRLPPAILRLGALGPDRLAIAHDERTAGE